MSNGEHGDTPVHDESWQAALQRYYNRLTAAEAEQLHADAIRSLDRATRARHLETAEIARLSAIADYLAPRIEKRQGDEPPAMVEGVLMGLMAGYQLAVGEAAPQEPDPFPD